MPITLQYGPPAGLEALLGLEAGRQTGLAQAASQSRQNAQRNQELMARMMLERYRAQQQAYRDRLQAQTRMALGQQDLMRQAMYGQQRMAQQEAQREWEAQAAQREAEQLEQLRTQNRDAFLSGQKSLAEYQQADAAFAARLAGLDPNAQQKNRQSLLQEFQKRADPADQSALKGIHSRIAQLRQMVANGQYSPNAVQGALSQLNEQERALLESVQHKPDKSGPDPIQWANDNTIPGEKIGMSPGTKYQIITRNGAKQLVAVEDPIAKTKMEAEAKLKLEQAKATGNNQKQVAQAQQKAQARLAQETRTYNTILLSEIHRLQDQERKMAEDAAKEEPPRKIATHSEMFLRKKAAYDLAQSGIHAPDARQLYLKALQEAGVQPEMQQQGGAPQAAQPPEEIQPGVPMYPVQRGNPLEGQSMPGDPRVEYNPETPPAPAAQTMPPNIQEIRGETAHVLWTSPQGETIRIRRLAPGQSVGVIPHRAHFLAPDGTVRYKP